MDLFLCHVWACHTWCSQLSLRWLSAGVDVTASAGVSTSCSLCGARVATARRQHGGGCERRHGRRTRGSWGDSAVSDPVTGKTVTLLTETGKSGGRQIWSKAEEGCFKAC